MTLKEESTGRFWESFHGPNMGYVEEQFELYQQDPNAVDPSIKAMFDTHGAPAWLFDTKTDSDKEGASLQDIKKFQQAMKYIDAIREYGHLEAEIYAIGREVEKSKWLDPTTYGLTNADLMSIPATYVWEDTPSHLQTAYDVAEHLKSLYTGKIAFEYDHITDPTEREWLQRAIETGTYFPEFSAEEKEELLSRLVQVEGFENFLQTTFVGQKRFSIEGLETMVPLLDKIIEQANNDEIDNVMMGMAHRGRLSVLAHVLDLPKDRLLAEFQHSADEHFVPTSDTEPLGTGWTGDVTYHFGGTREITNEAGHTTTVRMAHNPSHLEFVNPVVAGFTRAAQDDRTEKGYPKQDLNKAFSVLVHGDAAFIGEGIVAETLNISGVKGYYTGGTIHVIANNLVGYTTDQEEGRATRYSSDLVKGFDIPVVHVNADDPISCLHAALLAYEYRKKFKKDFLIDVVGYRRYGHNEMDEPRTTQPVLYKQIDEHPTVVEIFADSLEAEGVITADRKKELEQEVKDELQSHYESLKVESNDTLEIPEMPEEVKVNPEYDTTVSLDVLKKLNADLLKRPEGFNQYRRLNRVFKRRENLFEDEESLADWGAGEALAYASILRDGIPIRITGQDTERGTFAHRHMVLYDSETNESYSPLHGMEDAKASFDIHNSPLSETGVLGFEYGYSVYSPETLVIWEAQFGDFANVGQVIFDQFLSAARSKWGDISNMVMLLPHGYEGQGPEHSSARLERFLQMAGEYNWTVANVTSSAQLFHLLRRQAMMKGKPEARPLVIMSPKSLLRSQRAASSAEEFTNGKFELIRQQPNLRVSKKNAKRLLLGTGKVMVDIEEAIEQSDESFNWLRALRIEQLYPFPKEELIKELKQLPSLEEIVWVQEEPKNMGAWNFVSEILSELLEEGQTLRYVGRPRRSSPSVGEPNIHKIAQEKIVAEAINPNKGGNSSEGN
ncbi:MAG TPA: 2-oxoglutarate dehydrogenase E1 component [Bacillota bacterium]|nr:2-oxoglutarate dehydrogenase E1 component [Bacillota bacterium]